MTPPPAGPTLTHDPNGVATLSLHDESEGFAGISLEFLHRIEAALDELESGIARGTVSALVLRLGGPPRLRTDLDADEVRTLPDAEAARVWSREGQRVVQRIEDLAVPTVAAVKGRCLWAGTQLALACEHRLAVRDARVGVPESRWGVLPAWGGTVRLPRLIGVRNTLYLLLQRDTVSARRAAALGLVDEVLPATRFDAAIERFVQGRLRRRRPVERSRRGLAARVIEDTAPGRRLVLREAARRIRGRAGLPPHVAETVLAAVADGIAAPLEPAFARETERFTELLQHPDTAAFLHHDLLLHGEHLPPACAAPPLRIRRVGVLGGGTRGAALAHLCASRGIGVRLKEVRRDAALAAEQRIRALFAWDTERRSTPEQALERRIRRVSVTTGYGGFGRKDVVVEAVTDRPAVRRRALQEVEEHVREGCVLLTTSVIVPISELGLEMVRPDRVAGLHLFHPAEHRRLAEVVRGADTSEETLRVACSLARRLGKTPLVVADRPGRVVHRLLVVYLLEALRLRAEGVEAAQVDAAMLGFGMPAGPFRLFAEFGAEGVERIVRGLEERLGARFAPPPVRPAEPERRSALLRLRSAFRKARNGDAASRRARERAAGADTASVQQRLLLPLVNESALILEEGVVSGPHEVDRAVALSLGFPVTRGGLLFDADRTGAAALVRGLLALQVRYGSRFSPAPLLCRMAADGSGFYSASGAPLVWHTTADAGQRAPGVLT
jgi:3-hydroxyacyl-CoA dehydrogenase / enoyl-CoA hydratase / 3-hydroxybutyryl-CoA epimerase